jgi:anti-sigma factor RsiW
MTTDELACQELVELVTAYLEGTLDPAEKARFDEHLGVCPGCHTYLEQMRRTIEAVGRLKVDHLQPERRQELLQLFRDWKAD